MIGNDIIDLRIATVESNWRRPNYLSKIFTPAEQELVYNAENPDQIVWWLWSAKEAVYKIVNRQTLQRRYAPLSFSYINAGAFHNVASFFNERSFLDEESSLNEGASLNAVSSLNAGLFLTAGSFLHEHKKYFIKSEITTDFIHTIAVENPELFPHLEVCKDPAIPYTKNAHGLPMIANQPVSISHHGRYWAMVKQKALLV